MGNAKDDGDELILAKGFAMGDAEEALTKINTYKRERPSRMSNDERFAMPKLHLNHRRDYIRLTGKFLANEGFEKYFLRQMFENIKFETNHKGARVENEAGIVVGAGWGGQEPRSRNSF